jgi:hypothetical protein
MKPALFWYRAALRLLPPAFRARYACEMTEIASARIAEEGWLGLLAECASVCVTALRLGLGSYAWRVPALAVAALLFMLLRSGPTFDTTSAALPADSIDFQATDPAGEFTLQVRAGRVVAGSIDRQPLPRAQLVHTGDSIRVLNPKGRVLFAVAYKRDAATIEWEARPARCRGRALECGAYQ